MCVPQPDQMCASRRDCTGSHIRYRNSTSRRSISTVTWQRCLLASGDEDGRKSIVYFAMREFESSSVPLWEPLRYCNSTLMLACSDSIVLYDTCRLRQHILFMKSSLILSDHQVICTACISGKIGLKRTVACRRSHPRLAF